MIVKAVNKKMRIDEVPVQPRSALDPERLPHLRRFRDGWRHISLLFLLSPRWLFTYPAIALLAIGVCALVTPLLYPAKEGGYFGVYTMVFGSAFIIAGISGIQFSLCATIYSEKVRFHQRHYIDLWCRYPIMEFSLGSGFLMALLGLLGSAYSLLIWSQEGDDPTVRLSVAIPSVVLLIVGVQLAISSVFIALLLMGESEREKPTVGIQ